MINPLFLIGAGAAAYLLTRSDKPALRSAYDAMTPEQKKALLEFARTATPEQIYAVTDPTAKAIVMGFVSDLKRQDVIDYVNAQDFIKYASPMQFLHASEATKYKLIDAALRAGRTDVADAINAEGYADAWFPFLSVEAQAVLYANNIPALQKAVEKKEYEASHSINAILKTYATPTKLTLMPLKGYVRVP